MTEHVIRIITPDDAGTVFHLVNELNASLGEPPVTGQIEDLCRFIEQERLFGHCADLLGATVGYVIGHDCVTTDFMVQGGYMSDLFVVENKRGKGIGRQLVDAFAATIQARGGNHIWWMAMASNQGARRAYEAIGATEEEMTAHALVDEQFEAAVARASIASLRQNDLLDL